PAAGAATVPAVARQLVGRSRTQGFARHSAQALMQASMLPTARAWAASARPASAAARPVPASRQPAAGRQAAANSAPPALRSYPPSGRDRGSPLVFPSPSAEVLALRAFVPLLPAQ